jgi:hypothetical protein
MGILVKKVTGGGVISVDIVEGGVCVSNVLDVFALSVTGAVIGARRTLASLSFVSGKAFASTRFTVANTTSRTLGVTVSITDKVWLVNPSEIKRTDLIRTISRVHGKTKTPVIETGTDTVNSASSVPTAQVVATSADGGNKG